VLIRSRPVRNMSCTLAFETLDGRCDIPLFFVLATLLLFSAIPILLKSTRGQKMIQKGNIYVHKFGVSKICKDFESLLSLMHLFDQ